VLILKIFKCSSQYRAAKNTISTRLSITRVLQHYTYTCRYTCATNNGCHTIIDHPESKQISLTDNDDKGGPPPSPPPTAAADDDKGHPADNDGGHAGVIIGVCVGVAVLAGFALFAYHRRKMQNQNYAPIVHANPAVDYGSGSA
jgi:hypothetical protein